MPFYMFFYGIDEHQMSSTMGSKEKHSKPLSSSIERRENKRYKFCLFSESIHQRSIFINSGICVHFFLLRSYNQKSDVIACSSFKILSFEVAEWMEKKHNKENDLFYYPTKKLLCIFSIKQRTERASRRRNPAAILKDITEPLKQFSHECFTCSASPRRISLKRTDLFLELNKYSLYFSLPLRNQQK